MLENISYPLQHIQALSSHLAGQPYNIRWNKEWRHFHMERQAGEPPSAGFLLSITVSHEESDNLPYDIHLEAFAAERIPPDSTLEAIAPQAEKFLLGMARERIRTLTGDAPWGAVLLPPFEDMPASPTP